MPVKNMSKNELPAESHPHCVCHSDQEKTVSDLIAKIDAQTPQEIRDVPVKVEALNADESSLEARLKRALPLEVQERLRLAFTKR